MSRSPLAFALLLCAIACSPSNEGEPERTPNGLNVLLITLDTTRADALEPYGQPLPSSPNIASMAGDGVLFSDAVTSAPSTLPAHASILTGLQPFSHGARSNSGYVLSEQNATLAEALQAAGYRTAAQIAAPVIAARTRLDQGFDVYRDPYMTRSVVERLELVGRAQASGPDPPAESPPARNRRDGTDITHHGLEFLRAADDRPFFLWLHYFDAHAPYAAPEPFASQLPGAPYLAEVLYVDHQIGELMEELTRLKLRETTLVVLTADHGEGRGDHSELTHSFFVYDSTMRVPLIFWGADLLPRGEIVTSLVRTADIAPTVLDLLGLPPLPGPTQGVSLRPLLTGASTDLELIGYGESIEPHTTFGSSVLRFVREGRWKYIHKLDPALYDVAADPGELRNLAAEHPEIVERLRQRLHQLVAEAPPKPADSEVSIDAETQAQLLALGYAGAGAASSLDDELAALTPSGPDPDSKVLEHVVIARAWGNMFAGEYERAAESFRSLWTWNPESSPILMGLTQALTHLGRHDELIPLLRKGIEIEPESTSYRINLALLLKDRGEYDEAEPLLREILALKACSVTARLHLADLLLRRQRHAEQIEVLAQGDPSCPGSVATRNGLAYVLATAPDPALRDGGRAVRLAEAAVAESEGRHPDYLDTLAAAYAEIGDFERAVAEERRALAQLEDRDVPDAIVGLFRRNLARFEAGEPLREP